MVSTREEWLKRREFEFSNAKDVSDTSSADEADEGSDDGRPSFSDDSLLGTDTSICARVRHDDHWDRVVDDNPWERPVDIWEWRSGCVERGADTKTNTELEQEDKTREWLEKLEELTFLHLQADPKLLRHSGKTRIEIPLCEAPNGDEYRLVLTIQGFSIPTVWCPAALETIWNGEGYWARLQSRLDQPDNGTSPPLRFPTMAIALGNLAIVTTSRSKWFGSERVTEYTDYDIVVDISSDDLSLWIIASRSRLDTRAEGTVWQPYVPCLPIFDGLMSADGVGGGYDLACIAPSIRLLRGRISDQVKAPTWKDMCAWVRKTRTNFDVVAVIPHKDEVKTIGEAATKKLAAGANRGIVARVWGCLARVF